MSATLERPTQVWETRPGWGIGVDLTPREVLVSRRVRVHQRMIGLGLVLVLIGCVGISLLVLAGRDSAQRDYDRELSATSRLTSESAQYADITAMQTITERVRGDLSGVMAPDVDVVNLLAHVRESRPVGLTVTDQSVLMTPPVAPAPPPAPVEGEGAAPATPVAPVAPVPADQVVGTVTVSGNGPDISGINPFVAQLNRMRGVIDVVPTSVTQAEDGMTYTISFKITGELYTGRYALDPAATPAVTPATPATPAPVTP